MANQVNWGMPELRSNGPEIASIAGLLGSIADAREKKRQWEAEQALRQQQADQQEQHQKALEAYNWANLDQQGEHQRQSLAQTKELADFNARQEMQKAAVPQMEKVRHLVDTGDLGGAQELGGQVGVGVNKNQGLIDQRALQARQQRGTVAADSFSMLPGMPAAASAAFGDNARQGVGQENTDEELNPKAPPVQFNMPAGSTLDYDPVEAKQKAMAERGRLQQQFMEANKSGVGNTELGQEALTEVGNAMGTEGYKGDPVKDSIARRQALEQQANFLEAAKARQEPRPPNPQSDQRINQAAKKTLNSEVGKFAVETGIRDLKKAYGQTIKADRLMDAGTGEGEAAAIDEFIKTARGGMVTGQSLGFSMAHLGGALTRLETAWETLKTGQFSEQAMDNLTKSFEAARAGIKDEVEGIRQAFVDGFYAGGANDELKSNLDDHYDRLFSQFGYKADRKKGASGITPTGKRIGGGASYTPPAGAGKGTLAGTSPMGSDDMAVIPSGPLPSAAAAAGTGSKGVAGADPALLSELRALAKQLYEQRQQRRQQGGTR